MVQIELQITHKVARDLTNLTNCVVQYHSNTKRLGSGQYPYNRNGLCHTKLMHNVTNLSGGYGPALAK